MQEFFGTLPDRSGLMKELQEATEARCSMRLHCDAPSLSGTHAQLDFHETDCCKFAECLCGKNAVAKRMHANLVSLFRPFLRVKPVPKAKAQSGPGAPKVPQKGKKPVPRLFMEQGLAVFKFTKMRPENDAADPRADAGWEQVCERALGIEALQDLPEDQEVFVQETLWVHVSYANYRDWHFTFLCLEEDPDTAANFTANGQPLTVLRVPEPCLFLKDMVAFKKKFDLAYAWKAAMHVVFIDDQLLAPVEMAPAVVEVLRLASVPELQVWKAWRDFL